MNVVMRTEPFELAFGGKKDNHAILMLTYAAS